MAAYIIVNIEITDLERYAEYIKIAGLNYPARRKILGSRRKGRKVGREVGTEKGGHSGV